MVFSNTIGKGDTRTQRGTHVGQSFVRVNRVVGEKKKVCTSKKSLSLFRRDAIEIDVGSNAFRERRLGRAPGTALLEAGAEGSRRADASTVCRRDTDLCGSARPASRVPRAESLRALDILFGGTSACAVDGTRMTESARAYGSRKEGSTANALQAYLKPEACARVNRAARTRFRMGGAPSAPSRDMVASGLVRPRNEKGFFWNAMRDAPCGSRVDGDVCAFSLNVALHALSRLRRRSRELLRPTSLPVEELLREDVLGRARVGHGLAELGTLQLAQEVQRVRVVQEPRVRGLAPVLQVVEVRHERGIVQEFLLREVVYVPGVRQGHDELQLQREPRVLRHPRRGLRRARLVARHRERQTAGASPSDEARGSRST